MEVVGEREIDILLLPDGSEWGLLPKFLIKRGSTSNKSPKCIVQVFHKCTTGSMVREWEICGMTNKEEFKAGAPLPQYTCNACNTVAPNTVSEEKLLILGRARGYDPRNERNAALAATREKKQQRLQQKEQGSCQRIPTD